MRVARKCGGLSAVLAWWLCALVSAACLENPAVTCKNGLICAPGNVCDDAHGGCATSSQIVACTGKAEEAACSYPSVPEGACYEGVCLPTGCGNGVMANDEVCDDRNRFHGDGCSADCMSNETCGNGIIDEIASEQCDDGNLVDGDACQPTCRTPRCGDGFKDVALNEACDMGPANSETENAACRTNCQLKRCGDDVHDSDEICDDGNPLSGDGCSFDCRSLETCGNGYTDFVKGETCDDDAQSNDGCSECKFEVSAWAQPVTNRPSWRAGFAMAYDGARGLTMMFGGRGSPGGLRADTWVWDGAGWSNASPRSGSPPARYGHALAYDAARRRIVLFGGTTSDENAHLNDTWEWDGTSWTEVTPAGSKPSGRRDHALAYDAARQRVVLHGGNRDSAFDDTWEWNGTTWTDVTPTTAKPSARSDHALAYDAARGRVVLFGGVNGTTYYGDTWEWNGMSWTDVTPLSGNPAPRARHALAYDAARAQIVMVNGQTTTRFEETWLWNGSAWTDAAPSTGAIALTDIEVAYDVVRGRVVFHGSEIYEPSGPFPDTYEWDGSDWFDVTPEPYTPAPRDSAALAYDAARGRTVLFGGSYDGDTWEWTGSTWLYRTPEAPAPSPSVRMFHALAYDSARGRVVLFGGQADPALVGDVWEWDGSAWADVTPASGSPLARAGHALAYDSTRGDTIMFGGFDNSVAFSDTWRWNGIAWTDVTPASNNPAARVLHAIAYDPARDRVVLFGGADSLNAFSDTWEWDGAAWHDVTPASNNPPARGGHAMVYDVGRGRIVLFGGTNGTYFDDVWEWDGSAWTNTAPLTGSPPPRAKAGLAYDAAHGRVVVFGGQLDGTNGLGDTWLYQRESTLPAEGCHTGVDSDGDSLIGCADPDCFGYCSPRCNPTVSTCTAATPRCGDSTCQSIETKRLCPADCGAPPAVCGDFLCESPETMASCPGDCS